ncbi:MAG: tetratricopeptide repeat protein [Burkholderiales bacterium]|nr:tetratricopeptide repeat protein [Burkholderiales bacterium]
MSAAGSPQGARPPGGGGAQAPLRGDHTSALDNFERMLASGKDGALLRFSLGSEHLKAGHPDTAVTHLRKAVELDPRYTAAWKALGRALAESGQPDAALAAYRQGIAVAEQRGDKQAGKEMTVFARRIERAAK